MRLPPDTGRRDKSAGGETAWSVVQAPQWMERKAATEGRQSFDILPENWEAVNVFLACSTQWRRDRNDMNTGLRYEALDMVLRRKWVSDADDAFWRVRVMEDAALKEFSKAMKTHGAR